MEMVLLVKVEKLIQVFLKAQKQNYNIVKELIL